MSLPYQQTDHLQLISLPERLGGKHKSRLWSELKPLLRQAHRRVLLDLAQIGQLDWSGVILLMDAYAEVRRLDGQLALVGVQPGVMAYLELAQLNKLMPMFQDENAALAAFD